MSKKSVSTIFVVLLVSLSLVGMALAQDNSPDATGSRSGSPDTTPPIQYLSPAAFSQGFDDINILPGWFKQNNSSPLGVTSWFQGNSLVFPAQAGAPNAYIAANFNNGAGFATISNWLLTPVQPLNNGAQFSFWTRTVSGSVNPDRLQVRLSLSGDSLDVGSTVDSVGVFTTLLLDINQNQVLHGYPEGWARYIVTLSGIPAGSTGRFAFRYYVTNGGPSGVNSNFIGIDTVEYTNPPILSVNPLLIYSAQASNRIATYPLQICNVGGPDLDWAISEVPANWLGTILLIETQASTSGSVQRALYELSYPFNLIRTSDFTGIDFTPYRVVIVGMDGGAIDQPSIQKLRTDVINTGKRLIFLGGTNYQNFVNGVNQYLVLNDTASHGWVISAQPHFTTLLPAHPLAQGLPSPYNFLNPTAAFYSIRVTDPNILAVARNGDGYTSLLYKNASYPLMEGNTPEVLGDFIWFINTPQGIYWNNPEDYTFLKQVIKNSINSGLVANNEQFNESYLPGSTTPDQYLPLTTGLPFGPQPLETALSTSADTTSSQYVGQENMPPGSADTSPVTPLTEPYVDAIQGSQPTSSEDTPLQVTPDLSGPPDGSSPNDPTAVLWDNGPLITHPAACAPGRDDSRVQTSLGMTVLGYSAKQSLGFRMADEFTVTYPQQWAIQNFTFFAYQTGAPISPSPFTAVYYQIWDGPPSYPGSHVIYGDMTTNRLQSSTFTNILRSIDTATCGTTRNIFANVVSAGLTLGPGTYWLDWTMSGNESLGLFVPPVTAVGQTTTGNGMQFSGTTWVDTMDVGPQGLPFTVEGTYSLPDFSWLSVSPGYGTLAFNACTTVNVTFNSTGLPPSAYFADLRVWSNDPFHIATNVFTPLSVTHYETILPIVVKH